MSDAKRRLPMLKGPGEEPNEPRPPWHWVGFGVVIIFAAWLPLAYAASAVAARLVAGRAANVALGLLLAIAPLAMGAFAGGYVVGRWGEGPGARISAFAGLAVAVISVAITWFDGGTVPFGAFAIVLVAAPLAALGGFAGQRKRHGPGA